MYGMIGDSLSAMRTFKSQYSVLFTAILLKTTVEALHERLLAQFLLKFREDPRGRCARSTRAVYCRFYKLKISPSAKLAFYYGAFGAKGPARAGQKTLRNFSAKIVFLGVRESAPIFAKY